MFKLDPPKYQRFSHHSPSTLSKIMREKGGYFGNISEELSSLMEVSEMHDAH